MSNDIYHVEIVSNDTKAAAEFYSGVFGWKIQPWGEEYISRINSISIPVSAPSNLSARLNFSC